MIMKYKECFIVGGGPSLTNFNWSCLDNKYVIAINRAYEFLPQANIIYFTDQNFFQKHKEGLYAHSGELRRGHLPGNAFNIPEVTEYVLTGMHGIDMRPGMLRHGSNSVYAALNMAVQDGFTRIYLLGVDMKWSPEGKTHFHSGHDRIDPHSVYQKMITAFMTIRDPLMAMGITTINLNPDSALKVFASMLIENILPNAFIRRS